MQQFKGTGVALITPFKKDFNVDVNALKRLVDHCIDGGVDYLVVLGTTGEIATLTAEEKELVIQTIVEANASRLPLMLGVGGNNTQVVCDELKTRDFTAFEGILSVSPYYNKPTQAGIYAHYTAVAKASPVPVLIYNVPSRTGSNLLPQTVLKIARDNKNIFGIKEAEADMVQILRHLQHRPKGFMVISGDDMLALHLVQAGGDGVISVLGQGLPELMSGMIRDGLGGAFAKANQTHYKLMPVIDLIFAEGNPAGIKALLAHKGICEDQVRLPLMSASKQLVHDLATTLEGL